jgi:UDP-N-acetylmuramoylalanine--D-glutamate ligase
MIGCALSAAFGPARVHVGGNLGGSLLENLANISPDHWIVLELSSFMLEGLRQDRWSPHIALVTNLTPNHLDRHKTLDAYRAAKQAILDHQSPSDAAVLGPNLDDFHPRTPRVTRVDSGQIFPCDLLLPGEHNRLNAAMALAASTLAGADPQLAAHAISTFRGLPHRLQLVAEYAGVRYFNDSKATTPEAAALAIRCFPPGTVHAILGGYDKKSDLAPLARQAAQLCRAIYTIGVTGPAIAAASQSAAGSAEIVPCETLDRAIAESRARAQSGQVVLLSPACASWDQFENYEQRGETFTALVTAPSSPCTPDPRP